MSKLSMRKGDFVETADGTPGYILGLDGKTHAFVQWFDDTPYDHLRLEALAPLDVPRFVKRVHALEQTLTEIRRTAREGRANAPGEPSIEDSADFLVDTLRSIEKLCTVQLERTQQ